MRWRRSGKRKRDEVKRERGREKEGRREGKEFIGTLRIAGNI